MTTFVDDLSPDGACSLREAIQAANSDSVVDQCSAGDGADTILLPTGVYSLTLNGSGEDWNQSGDLDITDTVTIRGEDMENTRIDGQALDRVLHVHPGAVVTLTHLTISNGHAPDGPSDDEGGRPGADGGGILNQGSLILDHALVHRNRAGKGGTTQAHMPLSGSPAVDAGDCFDSQGEPITIDQRGAARPQGNQCDIGAVESPHDQAVTRLWLPVMAE